MNESIKNYFVFNKGERIGIFTLIALIIIVLALPYLVKFKVKDNKEEFDQFVKEIALFEKSIKAGQDSLEEARKLDFQQMDKSVAENKIMPFVFNPNQLPSEQWSRMGLKDWQIKTIKNYEAKGGKFYKKEDFKKMFCISPSEYEILEPYISIPETHKEYAETKVDAREKPQKTLIELNTADSVGLLQLYGVGPSFAKRIVKYRNLLGGFYSKKQLMEVYGFDQDKLDQVEDYCEINPERIKKININKVRTEELKKHPYFDYYTAKAVVDQRIILGKFSSLEQIKEIPLIHDEMFNKIKNYLTLD